MTVSEALKSHFIEKTHRIHPNSSPPQKITKTPSMARFVATLLGCGNPDILHPPRRRPRNDTKNRLVTPPILHIAYYISITNSRRPWNRKCVCVCVCVCVRDYLGIILEAFWEEWEGKIIQKTKKNQHQI